MITERKALLELKTILIKTMDERGGSGLNDTLIVLNDLILASQKKIDIEIDATNHRLKTYQDNLAYIEHRIKVELKILEELK